jgi:D-glycero-alpha-D-manno-heptose-7-phosphate kinase
MIITKTPLRISFLGGGTDFRGFFHEEEGWVLSSAIDKFIYVIIKERFDRKIRVGYTRTEMVDDIDEIQHELVREALRKTGITQGVEISTMADIPTEGSGLGSSSTVTVGLLNAMYHFLNQPVSHEQLAREACEIEIDVLGKPIGIQDQYIAAYGGQRFLHFGRAVTANGDGRTAGYAFSNGKADAQPIDSWGQSDLRVYEAVAAMVAPPRHAAGDRVTVESLALAPPQLQTLNDSLLLFYTNIARKAESVLGEQVQNMAQRRDTLRTMKALALQARTALETNEFDEFGRLLDESWQLKKQLASRVSNSTIDDLYDAAKRAGAIGGKITGAGGGGFLLLYCHPQQRHAVRQALASLPELPFRLESHGTRAIFNHA